MDYAATLSYMYEQLPMFSRIGTDAYKKDLTNTLQLCAILDDPHKKFLCIHVAGTNGKGSVSHMLAAILQEAGYKTGLYTSPHLKDFRERIKINGEVCTEAFVVDFIERMQPDIETIRPSFFEITVAMAFECFAREAVDVAVIETGLGGRLDSTNIIHPQLSIITNIGWDHMNILGDSLEKIAFEKAGIIKNKVPVVIGEVIPETQPIFETVAAEKEAPLVIAAHEFMVTDWKYAHHLLDITVAKTGSDEHAQYQLDLTGIYQLKNIVTVLAAVRELQRMQWKIDAHTVRKALQQTKKINGLRGRWELLQQHPRVICDVAHNEDGMRQLVEQLELETYRQLHIIIGMVKDKDITKVLSLLPAHATYYFTRSHIPRALPEESLAEQAALFHLKGNTYPDVNRAIKYAVEHAHEDDLILVCGSVFLAGEISIL